MTIRVRFAPSPTGYLHIGGVRTALYSWLWARQNGGAFILRIEDTDRERSTVESIQIVLESMRWLGLDWDEGPEVGGDHGPYTQSERTEIYAEFAEKLLQSGHAYRCYATKDEIAEAREAHRQSGAKAGFRFRSPWRDRANSSPNRDAPHVIRFRAPTEGSTSWTDLIKGKIEVPNDTQQDFVLLRSLGAREIDTAGGEVASARAGSEHGEGGPRNYQYGLPLYNFGCVVDDLTMGVTLVTRGDDHVVNTAPQILIYEALGATAPEFAHMPMVLAPNGEKLSKRHAAVGVLEYRDMGYLPDAVLNYLARLGWSFGDQEIFTREELIEKFDWQRVGAGAGRYDAKKFLYVQAEHLRMIPEAELAERMLPFLQARQITVAADNETLRKAIPHVKQRAQTLVEMAEGVEYFFKDVVFEEKAQRKFLVAGNAAYLEQLSAVVATAEPFTTQEIEQKVHTWLEQQGLHMKAVAQPARVALTGRTRSPGLFEVMEVLGHDKTLARLAEGARLCADG